ncbi:transcription factor MYB124 [Diospyros lotus]|uniref:transcription factor MYB124 n=1 Tax=Diospyros lotus TaxID=55363 RepID=UPI00225C11B5|nr:transcription factor MYB124 [Diospyros lotus]XP_052174026.1 transcription factor MYB124 [Diospyros lotus]
MQNMKKNCDNSHDEVPKQKERRIVSWSQEEDDILREQIRIHGTENWSIIASKFKDKTTRQCRRRWYTYLNSDFKKGGWSPEEDMLLCEAQKIFGNRWTEIAKVVSGRTDNAVKNRFTTLCKKRAKHEALAKENNTSYIYPKNKRVLFRNGFNASGISENASPMKKMRRTQICDLTETCNRGERIPRESGTTNKQLRPPFAVLVQNFRIAADLPTQHCATTKETSSDAHSDKTQGTFLKKDDPRIFALMQQAELLSSLAVKVNTENTDQSLENAWKVLQGFLHQTKGSDMLSTTISDMDFQLENFKDLVEDLRSSIEGSQPPWRQPELYEESSGSSEYSTGSTILSQTADKTGQTQGELCAPHQDCIAESQSTHVGDQNGFGDRENGIISGATGTQDFLPSCNDLKDHDGVLSSFSSKEFSSPLQVTPIFRTLAAGIPSPKFSESERQFLLKTLGMESPSCNLSNNASQPPPCKRALLHSL